MISILEMIMMGERQQAKLADAKIGSIEMLMNGGRF